MTEKTKSRKKKEPEVTEAEVSEVTEESYNPKSVGIALLTSPDDILKLPIPSRNWIFLWMDPSNIANIVEINMKCRKLQKDYNILAEMAILDLARGGFPPMNAEDTLVEFRRLLNLYERTAQQYYEEVGIFDFTGE